MIVSVASEANKATLRDGDVIVRASAVGVTEFDAAEEEDVPMALVAVTVNVYAVPFVSPETMIGLPVEVAEKPPVLLVAV